MRVWRTLHAEGMYPYYMQRVQHLRPGNFAERLEFCSMAVASCIVTSCLLMKRNSITTVSIIHTTLMCGQMRIPMPLWKATFNNVLVSMCGVQFWISADWSFHLGRSSYRRGVPQISAGGISPTFGGCAFK